MGGFRWHVFCRVVDNYGDAGVCWRLARQLAAEHALDVTLWIDRLATLVRTKIEEIRRVGCRVGEFLRGGFEHWLGGHQDSPHG